MKSTVAFKGKMTKCYDEHVPTHATQIRLLMEIKFHRLTLPDTPKKEV